MAVEPGEWLRLKEMPVRLPDELWSESGPGARSAELTPLYVLRHVGPHSAGRRTAHDFWELLFVFRGTGSLQTDSGELELRKDRAVLIPPGLAHCERSAGVMDNLWVGLAGRRLESWSGGAVAAANPEFGGLLEQLWLRAQRAYGSAGPELDGLTLAFFGCFWRVHTEPASPDADIIDAAALYVGRHYAEPLTVGELAGRFGYSEGHFHRAFRRRTGQTPLQFLTQVRLKQAVHLLQATTLSAKEVARRCGYADPLYFSRIFQKSFGCGPREYRGRG